MRISTKGRYATRALLDIARRYGKSPVLLKDISARQGIPLRYLEQIVRPLVSAKIIKTRRGPGGGVMLAKPPQKIRMIDVIQLLEGPLSPIECVGDREYCTRAPQCAVRELWSDLARAMSGVLESTTLQDLLERQKKKSPDSGINYGI
ncbi:MAG: Rrf2 family transcriptional regulator [Dehalococcoidia bacterium]|nr:Rrf2 family transcriptional regulator [Dehalococcoidia bacterium]